MGQFPVRASHLTRYPSWQVHCSPSHQETIICQPLLTLPLYMCYLLVTIVTSAVTMVTRLYLWGPLHATLPIWWREVGLICFFSDSAPLEIWVFASNQSFTLCMADHRHVVWWCMCTALNHRGCCEGLLIRRSPEGTSTLLSLPPSI